MPSWVEPVVRYILTEGLPATLMVSAAAVVGSGIVGILLGSGTAYMLSRSFAWNTQISSSAVILAFLFSAAVGVVFGVWPARRAAMLDPIQALRYE